MKRTIGIVLIVVCIAGFVGWSLQPSDHTPSDLALRSFVGGLLAGGAVLSWVLLVRKRAAKP